MADYVVMPKEDWQDVLDSTRERAGTSALLKSSEVGSQIRAIPSGDGGITPIGTKKITENGTYDVSGYASAEVGVETPTEELSVTENGEYVPPAGKHFSVVTVNVEATGSGDGTSEDLTAELTEQDELLTAIESLLNGSSDEGGDSGDSGDSGSGGGASGGSATLTVTFGYEMEEENEEGDYEMVIHEPYSAVGYYTVDGGEAEYFDGEEEISIDASIGSVVEISVSDIYGMSGEFNTTNEVGCVGAFLSEEGGEFGGCPDGVQITITESDASVTVYECYA